MDKVYAAFQFVAHPWYKARDFVAAHPNVALFVTIGLIVLLVVKP